MSETSENIDDMQKRIEADRRSILESILNTDLIKASGSATPSDIRSNENYESVSDDLYNAVFSDTVVDDSEEAFQEILRKAKIAFKQEQEFKKRNPYFKTIYDDIKEPSKKMKQKQNKMIQESIKLINNFRRSLIKNETLKSSILKSSKKNIKKNKKVKKSTSNLEEKNLKTNKVCPVQKNENKEISATFKKMYTPNQIYKWVETNEDLVNVPDSTKTIRSDISTCNSKINNKCLASSITSPINLCTSVRNKTVQFKPSPPEHFSYSNYENSSNSSTSNFSSIIKNEKNESYKNDLDTHQPYFSEKSDTTNKIEVNEYYSAQYKKYLQNPYEYKKDINETYSFNNNNSCDETHGTDSKSPLEQTFFKDFIRNLNSSISNNYNMEVKCSMKFQLFQ